MQFEDRWIRFSSKEAGDSIQICNLLSDGLCLDGMFSTTAEGLQKRDRWASWALCHFNEIREQYHLQLLDAGLNEHSACEFIRYVRQMIDSGWFDEIPPAIRARIPKQYMHRETKAKKQKV